MSDVDVLREGEPSEVAMDPARVEMARQLLRSHVEDGSTPTLVAVVARHGVIVLAEALGQRGPGMGPVQLDDPTNVASISKSITAALVMMFAEDGVLSINRPVVDYLPDMPREGNDRILLSHLLTHTSGFDSEVLKAASMERVKSGEYSPCPEGVDLMTHLMLVTNWDTPRSWDVGSRMNYCNLNFSLLGEVLRRVSGASLDALARRRLFEPLGMVNSGFVLDDAQARRRIRRGTDVPGGQALIFDDYWLPGFETPEFAEMQDGAGGLKTSASDVAIFGQMLLNAGRYGEAKVLSAASVAAMMRNQTPGIPVDIFGQYHPESGWGYGLSVNVGEKWAHWRGGLNSIGSVGHGGSGGSIFSIDPVTGVNIVVLEIATRMNEYGEAPSCVADRFESVIYSSLVD
ncbi:MAG TPA: serine hydrolase domain-containing protein [Acidimicrobiales bacterium]|nr:serine hydrolase domain-containing protein [Acidimicrobiales bacterium]